MIRLSMTLVPYGSQFHGESELISAQFYTIPFGKEPSHGYRIVDHQGVVLAEGKIPKAMEGHRNPLHLLRDVLAAIDFEALGTDYVKTKWD